MLISLSNHSVKTWKEEQLQASSQYGMLQDITFPNISPDWDTEQVKVLTKEYFMKIKIMKGSMDEALIVHLSGELIFCFLLAQLLLNKNILVVTSATERIVNECDSENTSIFQFKKFRQYKRI